MGEFLDTATFEEKPLNPRTAILSCMVWTRSPDSHVFLRMLLRDSSIAPHMARLYAHHADSARHSVRVAHQAIDLGIENRVMMQELLWLGAGAALHDVGKSEIPIGILAKPGRLNDSEFHTMDDHNRKGYRMLGGTQPDEVRYIVVGHHEHQANPYPRHPVERRQHPRRGPERRSYSQTLIDLTQIVAAADMYDALSSARGYKPSLPLPQVEQIMHEEYRGNPIFRRQVLERAA